MDRSSQDENQLFSSRTPMLTAARKCFIVDDNPECIRYINEYISMYGGLEVMATFADPITALRELSSLDEIDILFVDVEMPVMNGLELAQKLVDKVNVLIFASAHGHYALNSYGVKAKGYLLKPFSFAMFEQAVTNALERSRPIVVSSPKATREYIFIKNKQKNFSIVRLNLRDIILAESVHDDIILYTTSGAYTTHISLKKLEELLYGYDNFVRVHRAFVVSITHISEVRKNKVSMSNGTEVCIGDFYRDRLFRHINANLISFL